MPINKLEGLGFAAPYMAPYVPKDKLEKFVSKHPQYEEFVSTIQEDNPTMSKDEVAQFAKDVRKSVKRQEFRKDNFFKTLKESVWGSILGPIIGSIYSVCVGHPGWAALFLTVPTAGVVADMIDKDVSAIQSKLEREGKYYTVGDHEFQLESPDGKKLYQAEIKKINGEKVPVIKPWK